MSDQLHEAFVEVYRSTDPVEAEMVNESLCTEGIDARLLGTRQVVGLPGQNRAERVAATALTPMLMIDHIFDRSRRVKGHGSRATKNKKRRTKNKEPRPERWWRRCMKKPGLAKAASIASLTSGLRRGTDYILRS